MHAEPVHLNIDAGLAIDAALAIDAGLAAIFRDDVLVDGLYESQVTERLLRQESPFALFT